PTAESKPFPSIGSTMAASVMAQFAPCSSASVATAPSACSIASAPSAVTAAQSPLALATLPKRSHAKAEKVCKANVCTASWTTYQASAQCTSHCSCIVRPTAPCSIDCASSKPSQKATSTRANASQNACSSPPTCIRSKSPTSPMSSPM